MTEKYWTPERTDQMVKMYLAGSSATDIAQALGLTSRNAVCGKLDRMKRNGLIDAKRKFVPTPRFLERRFKILAGGRAKAITPAVKADAKPPKPVVVPIAKPLGQHSATLLRINPNGCRYIEGDYSAGNMDQAVMCGDPKHEGSAYCAYHKKLISNPMSATEFKRRTASMERTVMWKANQTRSTRTG